MGKPNKGPGARDAKADSIRRPAPAGLAARRLALQVLSAVLAGNTMLDVALRNAFEGSPARTLDARDKALARVIVTTVLRHHGELSEVLRRYLDKPLAKQRFKVWLILLSGAAQLLKLDVKPHAAISLSVDLTRLDHATRGFDRLVNAVLRRVGEGGRDVLRELDCASLNIPPWLHGKLQEAYGATLAREIARASLLEPALDLCVKNDSSQWAARLGGTALPTGTVRLGDSGRIEDLDGYDNGAWWVQDMAAALPARLLGDVSGCRVADVCAAPGGKTLQLAAAGAIVTAIDISAPRLKRLEENLKRTRLAAEIVTADALNWSPQVPFDAVLLDAPCSATGTLRRHPDILHHNKEHSLPALVALQVKLLDRCAGWLRPGGTLVYCTCSLLPEEGEQQIEAFLERDPGFVRQRLVSGDDNLDSDWLTETGDLRTLPTHRACREPELLGMDGFYAARLKRRS